MKKKKFLIIYNQDSTNLFFINKEPLTPVHVDRMVDEVADSGADVFLVNPNCQKVNYPSKVWETDWQEYAPGDSDMFDSSIMQMRVLAEQCDYLERALRRCRQRGLVPGVTVRMNDMHDAPDPDSHLHSRFWKEHPEFRLKTPGRDWAGSGLNYEYPEVRQRFLVLIDELVNNYDFDFLELDFMRFPCYFERNDFERHCEIMNDFLRNVRTIIRNAGKTIDLVPRVAATPSSAYSLGFDVRSWADERLVDGITTGRFLTVGWELPVDQFREAVSDKIPVYSCTEITAWRAAEGILPSRSFSLEPELLRGFAAGAHALGASGIEFFNFFCPREPREGEDRSRTKLAFDTFRELRDVEQLQKLPRRNLITTGTSHIFESDLPLQVPVEVSQDIAREFKLLLLAPAANTKVKCIVYIENEIDSEELLLHINAIFVGCSEQIEILNEEKKIFQAEFTLKPEFVRDGWNQLSLYCAAKVIIQSLEIVYFSEREI